jgi:hypothetical protein
VFSLGVGEGTFPVATGWGTVSREVGRLLRGSADEARERSVYWERREALTGEALALVALALAEPLPDSDVLADVEWLRTCLEVGQRLCRALAAGWKWKGEPTAPALAAAAGAVEDLESYLARHVPTDTTDPVGGDVAVWWATAAQLRALTAPPTQSPPPPAGP